MAKIVVSGYMIRYPVSGLLLAYFQYVLGLHRLGHSVVYVEESGWADSCFDPSSDTFGNSPEPGLKVLRNVLEQYEIDMKFYYLDRESGQVWGSGNRADIQRELTEADVLLNLGGVCWLEEFALCHRRILVDMDPFFTQVGQFANQILADYDTHFTYGMNIGHPGCTIPTAGMTWHGTVPPVLADEWSPQPPGSIFTTVAHWSAYGDMEFEGEKYGQKDVEFMRLLDLPRRTDQKLELALSGATDDIWFQFEQAGWSVVSGGYVSRDLRSYQAYLAGSRGEFSAAKNAYVKTRSGWFSDRTVCYLAASRPAVLQQTGFSQWLPTGLGVLGFTTIEEAADCLAQVNADYPTHCRAARELAMEFFDYRKVLPRLLEKTTVGVVTT